MKKSAAISAINRWIKAVIFDLDGTIVDNIPFHAQAFLEFARKHNTHLSLGEYYSTIQGRINKEIIPALFKENLTEEQIKAYADEKEAIYRRLYKNIMPVPGLFGLFKEIKEKGLKLALATSAPSKNVDYVLSKLNIRGVFDVQVNGDQASRGKPDPEIYLKTAEILGVKPKECLVFEDSVPGIKAAKAAGMTVIALTTSHPPEKLKEADGVIDDFTQIAIYDSLVIPFFTCFDFYW